MGALSYCIICMNAKDLLAAGNAARSYAAVLSRCLRFLLDLPHFARCLYLGLPARSLSEPACGGFAMGWGNLSMSPFSRQCHSGSVLLSATCLGRPMLIL